MYLLDTNVISELRLANKNRAHPNVVAWSAQADAELFFTSVVVMMEIERGILSIRRKDPIQADTLSDWFYDTVQPTFKGRILAIDTHTASLCAGLHVPDRAPDNDAWIAATALQHRLTLVTRNSKDFNIAGLRVFNPFEPVS